jgi:hypothetical protein
MDKDQGEWQDGHGFELLSVPAWSTGGGHNLLNHRQMDTLPCRQDTRGSAVQFNSKVSAMPANPTRTSPAPLHWGTADTLL